MWEILQQWQFSINLWQIVLINIPAVFQILCRKTKIVSCSTAEEIPWHNFWSSNWSNEQWPISMEYNTSWLPKVKIGFTKSPETHKQVKRLEQGLVEMNQIINCVKIFMSTLHSFAKAHCLSKRRPKWHVTTQTLQAKATRTSPPGLFCAQTILEGLCGHYRELQHSKSTCLMCSKHFTGIT